MSSLVSGVLGKFSYSVTWMFAAATAIGGGWLLLTPAVARLRLVPQITSLNGAIAVLAYSGAAATVGFVMGAVATPLYQVLEGYWIWPRGLRAMAISRQKRRKHDVQRAIDSLGADEVLEEGILLDRLSRYPADDRHIAPTGLGNALRAFESYGMNRYQLDSQLLWTELHGVIPKAIQDEVAGSRAGTDFFVAMVYLTILYGLTALGLAIGDRVWNSHDTDWPLVFQGAGVLIAGPMLCYHMAISTTDYCGNAVRAAVNLGRPKLAEAFGLAMPATFDEEQELWARLGDFVRDPYDVSIAGRLDAYRVPAAERASDLPTRLEIVQSIREPRLTNATSPDSGSSVPVPSQIPTAMWVAAAVIEFLIMVGLVVLLVALHQTR